jgi:hypothetical protein
MLMYFLYWLIQQIFVDMVYVRHYSRYWKTEDSVVLALEVILFWQGEKDHMIWMNKYLFIIQQGCEVEWLRVEAVA